MHRSLAVLLIALSAPTFADDLNRLPREHWEYMDGYRYEYSDTCTVRWSVRSASFVVPDTCPALSADRLNEDAIKSIQYARARSDARNFNEYYESANLAKQPYTIERAKADAKDLWEQTCIEAKSFKSTPFDEVSKRYPGIDPAHAGRLFSSAHKVVKGLGGVVNCAEQAHYAVETYASDIDIRAKS